MSLIMVDDDSSDGMAIDSIAGEINGVHSIETNEHLSNGNHGAPNSIGITTDEKSSGSKTVVKSVNGGYSQKRPILELMKHLINYNGKQNTTLTNAQLIGILTEEFKIDITNMHYISIDIYMNVLKKFLKDWPQWDEFDRVMHESRCMNDNEEIEKMLESEYRSLTEYLALMLKACKPWAREAAKRVKRSFEVPASRGSGPRDVILDVNCTRHKLNTLFFRRPHPCYNSSIFNVYSSIPSRISIRNMSLWSILNWSHISVRINLNCFKYKRELVHDYKHTLVNKKLNRYGQDAPLNLHLQTMKNSKKEHRCTINDVESIADAILYANNFNVNQKDDIEDLFRTVITDVGVVEGSFYVPSTFRHYMSPHRYVRYLYKDVDTDIDKYDIQLEEKIAPRLKFHITKICFDTNSVITDVQWLKLECTLCALIYVGFVGIEQLKCHFREAHQSEPDWMCTNCDETFTASSLASSRWQHECSTPLNTDNSDLSD